MVGAKSSLTLENIKLSEVLGKVVFRKVGKPFKNPSTGEVTTKITVLCDDMDDMFEVTVMGEVAEGTYKKNKEIDFDDCTFKISASGRKGFNEGEVNGMLNINVRAGKVIYEDDEKKTPSDEKSVNKEFKK